MTPLFTSTRERGLWIGALVVVVLIYSTLGLAQTLSDELQERSLFDAVFGVGFVLIVVAVATQAFRSKPGWVDVAIAIGIIGVALMALARVAVPAERTHLFEYALVAVLIHQALLERQRNGGSIRTPWLTAIGVTAALGTVDELIQAFIPDRVFDIRDVGFNALAAVVAVLAGVLVGWSRRRRPD